MGDKPERIPIWLRRLSLVGAQLREGSPLPAGAEQRIDLALSLMAEGLMCLYERAEKNNRGRRKAAISNRVREEMAIFRSLDADWIRRWRRERGRAFGR